MASAQDLDRSSTSPENPSSTAPPPSRRSPHRALGGGAVADVLLWRRPTAAALVAVGVTAFWLLFERSGHSFLSLIANTFLLLVTILFFWAKSATLLNRPLPPIPNLEISDVVVGRAAAEARVWINRVLSVAHNIAIEKDRKVFFEVIVGLWLVSYIGSFFNFLTLVYLGVLMTLTVPALYNKYQDQVHEKLGIVCGLIVKQYDSVTGKPTRQSVKEKKTQ